MATFSKELFAKKVGKFRAGFRRAFAMTTDRETFSAEDLALLERVADAVVQRGMATPATVFLESVGPMNFLGSQALHVLTPILELAFSTKEVAQVAHLLEHRETIPRLIALIEAKSAPKGASAR
ncbi:MAG TPA: hypothetical protein VNK46_11965 [Nitrospiraceae bacterium]|jgi:hypothetical protein|nr:hypothetical protein [Nitrospiraceae bacterium]